MTHNHFPVFVYICVCVCGGGGGQFSVVPHEIKVKVMRIKRRAGGGGCFLRVNG